MFQQEIAAMHPSLVTGHLQPAEMIAANYIWPPTAAQLEAPTDSQEAATTRFSSATENINMID